MARPQLEDGHTRIANEILEHLIKMHLSSNQWQVLLCIIRKTYGFHKKVDYIANFQIVEATGLCKAVVSRTLHCLSDMKLIDRKGKFIGFQKDWESWQMLAVSLTSETIETHISKRQERRIVRSDGYIGIWRGSVEPEFQSMATKQGYILEHRLIMARLLGRPLDAWEVVHHKGTKYPLGSLEDKGDNREENLELLPLQAAHMPSILAQQRIKKLESELAELRTIVDGDESKQNSHPKLAIQSTELAESSTKVSSPAVAQKIKDTIQKKGIYIILFDLWNSLNIYIHKKLTSDMSKVIDSARSDYSIKEIEQAMRNYAEIVKGAEYYFNHRWTMAEFLSRRNSNNIERFLDLETAKSNFKKEAGRGTHRRNPKGLEGAKQGGSLGDSIGKPLD